MQYTTKTMQSRTVREFERDKKLPLVIFLNIKFEFFVRLSTIIYLGKFPGCVDSGTNLE